MTKQSKSSPFFHSDLLRGLVLGPLLVAAVGLSGLALAREPLGPDSDPEVATAAARSDKRSVASRHFMVAAANPLASHAGHQVLREGGSAVDAAIAMQLVLALVEPQSSGLGGGAFMLVFEAAQSRVRSYDGRETAPAAATPERFLRAGRPLPFAEAVNSGKAVGAPGVMRMMELAHKRHGTLPWVRLFAPAIRLAEDGFRVSPRLHAQIAGNRGLFEQAAARAYFYPDDKPAAIGYLLKNPSLAAVLKTLAREGAGAFYQGRIAADIVAAVQSHTRPGDLSVQDLAGYRARERDPVCGNYRVYRVCGMGPPSSGGIAVLQMLGMLQQHEMAAMVPQSLQAVHYFAEAGRLAYADRGRYVADPDFIRVPVAGLLDAGYLRDRGAQIDSRISMGTALPGEPAGLRGTSGADAAADLPSTSHLVAVDRAGNAVSMTTTIESEFGSKIFVRGFLLNNQLTDFSLMPTDQEGRAIANRVEAGKRPRSSMAPVVVMQDGTLRLVAGSPGGSAIINYVAKTVIGVLDWELDVQHAIDLPNMGSRNKDTELERGTVLESYQKPLQRLGHRITMAPMPSGIQAIVRDKQGLRGGADSRREGIASGE